MNTDSSDEKWMQGDRETISHVDTIVEAEDAVFGGVSDHTLAFGALASRSCRYTIYYFLSTSESSASLSKLVTGIQTLAGQQSERQVRADDETLETLLLEKIIPQLERLGVIEYDARSETVRYYRRPFIEEYAEHAAFQELSTHE
ncbi:DUF7344 domain-containing protein [Natronorarus salvus]|uniref:DUF7344 domain-containing protein n=1 Tax=Natronorarus salvus TaxID=3117733 RepID=UPI002F264684